MNDIPEFAEVTIIVKIGDKTYRHTNNAATTTTPPSIESFKAVVAFTVSRLVTNTLRDIEHFYTGTVTK